MEGIGPEIRGQVEYISVEITFDLLDTVVLILELNLRAHWTFGKCFSLVTVL